MSTEPFRLTLISAERGIPAEERTYNGAFWGVPALEPLSVRTQILQGGRQQGVVLIHLKTGQLSMTIIPTRGMSILRVESGDVRFGWDSPVREVVHPHFINLQSRGGLGWLEGFNEWLVRCGLEFAGAPGRDRFTTNTGASAEMDLTLHGKIANIPASEVELVVDREPPYRVTIRGRVDEFMFYGPKLELWTEVSMEFDSNQFLVEDQITNRGGARQEFELIYHINFGPPLLEAGSRFVGPLQRVTPMNAHAAGSVENYAAFEGPTVGFIEQVYCLQPLATDGGQSTFLLRNAAANRAAAITCHPKELPCFTLWKNTNSLAEGYVTGLEPGTNYPHNRSVERAAGRLQTLEPGAGHRCRLECAVLSNSDQVSQAVARIARIQGALPVRLDPDSSSGDDRL